MRHDNFRDQAFQYRGLRRSPLSCYFVKAFDCLGVQPECLGHFLFRGRFDSSVRKGEFCPDLKLGVWDSLECLSMILTRPQLCDRPRELSVLVGIQIEVTSESENGGRQNFKDAWLNVLPGPDRIVYAKAFVGVQGDGLVCLQESLGNEKSHRIQESVVRPILLVLLGALSNFLE
jgi:hypothetical protein